MNIAEKKIAFYGSLVQFLRDEKFVETSAQALVQLFEELKPEISIEDFSVDLLREAYDEFHNPNADLDLTEEFTKSAFEDLSRHMRNKKAYRVFVELSEMSGTSLTDTLFVHITNTRNLIGTDDGPVVVTLVVDYYPGLLDFFDKENIKLYLSKNNQQDI
jgi:ADP-dependent phosphofructokinase/glucokinase